MLGRVLEPFVVDEMRLDMRRGPSLGDRSPCQYDDTLELA